MNWSYRSLEGKPLINQEGQIIGKVLSGGMCIYDDSDFSQSDYLEKLRQNPPFGQEFYDRMILGKFPEDDQGLQIPIPKPQDTFQEHYTVPTLIGMGKIRTHYKRAVIIDTSCLDETEEQRQQRVAGQRKLTYLLRLAHERGYISPKLAKRILKARRS